MLVELEDEAAAKAREEPVGMRQVKASNQLSNMVFQSTDEVVLPVCHVLVLYVIIAIGSVDLLVKFGLDHLEQFSVSHLHNDIASKGIIIVIVHPEFIHEFPYLAGEVIVHPILFKLISEDLIKHHPGCLYVQIHISQIQGMLEHWE